MLCLHDVFNTENPKGSFAHLISFTFCSLGLAGISGVVNGLSGLSGGSGSVSVPAWPSNPSIFRERRYLLCSLPGLVTTLPWLATTLRGVLRLLVFFRTLVLHGLGYEAIEGVGQGGAGRRMVAREDHRPPPTPAPPASSSASSSAENSTCRYT